MFGSLFIVVARGVFQSGLFFSPCHIWSSDWLVSIETSKPFSTTLIGKHRPAIWSNLELCLRRAMTSTLPISMGPLLWSHTQLEHLASPSRRGSGFEQRVREAWHESGRSGIPAWLCRRVVRWRKHGTTMFGKWSDNFALGNHRDDILFSGPFGGGGGRQKNRSTDQGRNRVSLEWEASSVHGGFHSTNKACYGNWEGTNGTERNRQKRHYEPGISRMVTCLCIGEQKTYYLFICNF